MPEFPTISTKKLVKIIEKKGFFLKRQKGSHAFYYNPNTKKSTVIPMHNRDVPKGILRKILHDVGISSDEIL